MVPNAMKPKFISQNLTLKQTERSYYLQLCISEVLRLLREQIQDYKGDYKIYKFIEANPQMLSPWETRKERSQRPPAA